MWFECCAISYLIKSINCFDVTILFYLVLIREIIVSIHSVTNAFIQVQFVTLAASSISIGHFIELILLLFSVH